MSILAFLDRYGTGTVPIHLSTSVNASLIPYRSDPIRDPVDLDRVSEAVPVYTGHALSNTTKCISLLLIVQSLSHRKYHTKYLD